jgi:hypothetical protein
MCSLKLPITVIEVIDKHRKHCLWRGNEFRKKGYNLDASDLVRRPKYKGGLGVINLSVQNDALLLKQLDKFYTKENIQWVTIIWQKYYSNIVPDMARDKGSFWWLDILRLHTQYRGVAIYHPNQGDTISFGMISMMAPCNLRSFLTCSILSRTQPSLFTPLGLLRI